MPGRHLTLRLESDLFDQLDARSRRMGCSRSDAVRTFLKEGLQMEAHPGVVFRDGPMGRRPGLVDGPDIWEVMRLFLAVRDQDGDPAERVADLAGLTAAMVRTAVRYYADHADEVDAWIERANAVAAEAEDAWHREQALLRR